MIDLSRKGNTIELKLYYHVPYGSDWTTTFEATQDGEHHAQLAYACMREAFEKAISDARRKAYEDGWKDKSSKKPKRNWFPGQL